MKVRMRSLETTNLGGSGRFGSDARHQVRVRVAVGVGVGALDLLAFGHGLRLGDRWGFGSSLRVAGVHGQCLLGRRFGCRFGLRKHIHDGRLLLI